MERTIVCLKHGTKYSSDYVNKLYNMVHRNSTVDFNFVCLTDDPIGLYDYIKVIKLPEYDLKGWWFKTWIFSNEFPISGTILFMDLDIVIVNNIDELWEYNPGTFCIIRDFNRCTIPTWEKFNSSIMRFESHRYTKIWDLLYRDFAQIRFFHGDQDWLNKHLTNFVYWPDIWIQSYKWEIRNRHDLTRVGEKKKFKTVSNLEISDDIKILVFHGEPNPEDVEDDIIIKNWK